MKKINEAQSKKSRSAALKNSTVGRLFSVAEITRKFHLASAGVEVRVTGNGEMTSEVARRIVRDAFESLARS